MSLWRKRNVHHNEQKPDHLVNILTNLSIKSEQKHDILSDPLDLLHDLSIKSDNLSIKSEEAMREVQRLGQEIQPDVKQSLITEPVAWVNKERNTITWDKLYPDMDALYTTPPQRTWVGLTDEEIGMAFRAVFPVGGVVFTNGATEFAQAIEAKLKDKNL